MSKKFPKKDNKKVVIIGGGPAGLTAAYQLSKLGRKSVVLEKDNVVGGLSRTVNYKNFLFDIGGHRFFTKIKEVEGMWKEVLGEDFLHCKRVSRIYYNKKFFYYPLRPFNTLNGLGLWNSLLILFSYINAHLFPDKNEDTFERWISNRFGKRLYEIFFKTYTQKVWGMQCNEIRAEWAAQRIKDLSLMNVFKNAFKRYVTDANKGEIIKTLIDSFEYPKLGPGMMWQAVFDIINKNGSKVYLNSDVEEIHWNQEENKIESVTVKSNDQENLFHGTDFISSMPIREIILKLQPEVPRKVLNAARNLKYRDFITVALIVNKPDLFPDNWIYVHDPAVKIGRIQNFKNWSPFMVPDPGKTCLGLEYFCFEGDELWSMPDKDLIELGKKELQKLDLTNYDDIEDGCVVKMPKAYPSYDMQYREMLNIVRRFLTRFSNLQLVGRNGMHRYNNQDHSMLTAMLAVENLEGANHDLWSVNDDPQYHENPDRSHTIFRQTLSVSSSTS